MTLSTAEIRNGISGMIGRFYKEQAQLKPGVANFLEELDRHALPVHCHSDRHLVEAALNRCGVMSYFSKIFTCSAVRSSKNEPFIFRAAEKI